MFAESVRWGGGALRLSTVRRRAGCRRGRARPRPAAPRDAAPAPDIRGQRVNTVCLEFSAPPRILRVFKDWHRPVKLPARCGTRGNGEGRAGRVWLGGGGPYLFRALLPIVGGDRSRASSALETQFGLAGWAGLAGCVRLLGRRGRVGHGCVGWAARPHTWYCWMAWCCPCSAWLSGCPPAIICGAAALSRRNRQRAGAELA